MSRYPVNKEFFPYSHFTPPIHSAKMAGRLGALMKPPGWLKCDKEVAVTRQKIKEYDNGAVEVLIFEPRKASAALPCLVYFHGGGFFFGGAGYHYRLAKEYSLRTPCKVVFVQYRLTPAHPFPTPAEDCYAALQWTRKNAAGLGIDGERIAVGGDSAGGALAASVTQMSRDRGTYMPCFQLLVYPVTDRRMKTGSHLKYTDTPMWNSRLSAIMWQGYLGTDPTDVRYASPMEAVSFAGLPDAYLETAEFDCLHDEGTAYATALREAGAAVTVNETRGTIHGFDIAQNAPTTKAAVAERIRFMQTYFSRNFSS